MLLLGPIVSGSNAVASGGQSKKTDDRKSEPFEITRLTQLMGLQALGPISPDKKYMLLIGKQAEGAPNVYVMRLDQLKVLPPLTRLHWSVTDPAWSLQADRIVFSGNDDQSAFPEIYVLNLNNSQLTRLTENSATDKEPVFSQDGKKVLYTTDQSPLEDAAFGILHVGIVDAAGGKPDYFTKDDISTIKPKISADGKSVYLIKIDAKSGRHSLWQYSPDGEPVKNLTTDKFARIHDYIEVPQTSTMVIWGQETPEHQDDIYTLDMKSLGISALPEPDLPKRSPAVSPNGNLIAFIGAAERGGQLFIYDSSNKTIRQLTFAGDHTLTPVFLSDTVILFGSDRDKMPEVYKVDLAVTAAEAKKKTQERRQLRSNRNDDALNPNG